MKTKFLSALLAASVQCSRGKEAVPLSQRCEEETDLDFVLCTLVDLSDTALQDICQRIGLDSETNVLPYLLESDEDAEEGNAERAYTHSDFVKAAEECLSMSMDLEMDGQWYNRYDMQQDPEMMITDILIQDEDLLKEIVAKLSKAKGRPEILEEIKSNGIMIEEGEGLEDRPDIIGFYLASMLSGDPSQFASLLSEHVLFQEDDPGHMGGWGLKRPSNPVTLQHTQRI